ncbi:methyltransferase domain-containing protein [Aquabacterium sp. A7-Y]|uniref:methyltransferase domain-containing protein n=1 Tax=Aquabacterium sp. A7-Y TaxID=1349605 RepID=UPI00223D088F|nr:methyltransferase domain-containing protein [Aquabacterium sp. A7-Y]MCW7536396.1 methyltransferase domain-containing protein [Aquabacterium sp. A7-Y]
MTRRKTPALAPVTVSESDGVRFLHLGTIWVQGAMRVRKPYALELEYIQRMMAWMLLRPEEALTAGHAVQLGLGAGAITKFCHKTLQMRCTAVELNPEVISVCRSLFRLPPDDERLTVLEQDAARYAEDPVHAGSADALCVDLYDHEAASPVLDDERFYAACHQLLARGGVMSVNLFGRDASFERSVERIAATFGRGALWTLKPTREGNTVVLATKGLPPVDRAVLAGRAENIETRFSLPARKWLRMIKHLGS